MSDHESYDAHVPALHQTSGQAILRNYDLPLSSVNSLGKWLVVGSSMLVLLFVMSPQLVNIARGSRYLIFGMLVIMLGLMVGIMWRTHRARVARRVEETLASSYWAMYPRCYIIHANLHMIPAFSAGFKLSFAVLRPYWASSPILCVFTMPKECHALDLFPTFPGLHGLVPVDIMIAGNPYEWAVASDSRFEQGFVLEPLTRGWRMWLNLSYDYRRHVKPCLETLTGHRL